MQTCLLISVPIACSFTRVRTSATCVWPFQLRSNTKSWSSRPTALSLTALKRSTQAASPRSLKVKLSWTLKTRSDARWSALIDSSSAVFSALSTVFWHRCWWRCSRSNFSVSITHMLLRSYAVEAMRTWWTVWTCANTSNNCSRLMNHCQSLHLAVSLTMMRLRVPWSELSHCWF